jgi:hypothetical protein
MARTIVGVIVGYVLMFILNICGFVTMYAVLGKISRLSRGYTWRLRSGLRARF